MNSISYTYLDEMMTKDDADFFKQLGQRIAQMRKEMGFTQVQLAELLGISQQHMASFEAGRRKVSPSSIPVLVQLFGVSADELLGIQDKPTKRGPTAKIQRQVDQIALLSRPKQKFITEMLEALIKQQQAKKK